MAEAIAADLLEGFSGRMSYEIFDLFVDADLPVLRRAGQIYQSIVGRQQWLYNLGFKLSDWPGVMRPLSQMLFTLWRRKIESFFDTIEADVVVVTHPLFVPSLTDLARRRLGLKFALVTVVTDIVTPHASWAWPGVDLCLVPTQEAFERLANFGLASSMLSLAEFPVHPSFRAAGPSRRNARRILGIDEDRFTVLVTGGGDGLGRLAPVVATIESSIPEAQILMLAGHNEQLYRVLFRSSAPSTRVYGHSKEMSCMMKSADLVIGKAGPSTMMEARAVGVPVILIDEVGRQEKGNAAYAERNGMGWKCRDISQLSTLVRKVAAGAVPSRALSEAADRKGKDVADAILALFAPRTLG